MGTSLGTSPGSARTLRLLGAAAMPAALLLLALVGGTRAQDASPSPPASALPAASASPAAPAVPFATPSPSQLPAVEPPPVPTPIAHPPAGDTDQCFECHRLVDDQQAAIATAWEASIHGKGGVSCADCHGGDPTSDRMGIAMDPAKGFVGKPSREQTIGICGSCHADPQRMKQYGLATDQYAKYWTSVHGQRLALANDDRVAICIDCHGSHDIKKASDPSAPVFPLNVPTLCARCHADAQRMKPYGIPTDQFDIYSKSVHGRALLEESDTRAPSCVSCHGSHDAKPPRSTEVVEVCGKCHTATEDLYKQSRHAELETAAPKCWTCHGTHDVVQPSERLFFHPQPPDYQCSTCHDLETHTLRIELSRFADELNRRCDTCHHPDSDIYTQIQAIDKALSSAQGAYDAADAKIKEAAGMGMIVGDADVALSEAKTSLIQAQAAVHTTKLPVISKSSAEAVTKANDAEAIAQARLDESFFRRQAMIIVVLLIVAIVAALVLVRRQVDRPAMEKVPAVEESAGDD